MSEHEWTPKKGERVAVVTQVRDGWSSVVSATVERVGKRDVVLDDGQRFNLTRGLTERIGGTWSTTTKKLVAADDPIVGKAGAEIRRRNLVTKAKNACYDFANDGRMDTGGQSAADVILALAPLTGVPDEIAALFTPTTTTEASA